MPVPTLDSFDPSPLRLEIHPWALLREGRLHPLGPFFPPEGPNLLVLWRPGEEPAFEAVVRTLRRGRRGVWTLGEPTPGEAWVVWWGSAPAPGAAGEGS